MRIEMPKPQWNIKYEKQYEKQKLIEMRIEVQKLWWVFPPQYEKQKLIEMRLEMPELWWVLPPLNEKQ